MSHGRLFVISGPSAVGKGTVVNEIMKSSKNVKLSISATTREPREGETEGVSYFFMTEEKFKGKAAAGGFLEYANVHGHYYGTPKAPVEESLAAGMDVILEIDVQGAMKVKESYGEGTYIFILPPSLEELRHRIVGRGTEAKEDIELRMGKAMGEMEYLDRYDYFIVNDELGETVETLKCIMAAQHQKIDEKSENLLSRYKEEA